MTQGESKKFKRMLCAKREELEETLGERDVIALERSADAMDEARETVDLDVALRNLDQESSLLHNVYSAIRRIEEGSFGICVNCREAITPQRLAAVPWTPLCIRCQRQIERGRGTAADFGGRKAA